MIPTFIPKVCESSEDSGFVCQVSKPSKNVQAARKQSLSFIEAAKLQERAIPIEASIGKLMFPFA